MCYNGPMTSRNRVINRTPRRPRQWGITSQNFSLAGTAEANRVAIDLGAELEADIASNLHNVTASAIRLNVSYRQTGAQRGDDDTVGLGIAWINQGAFDTGAGALPNPLTHAYDWMFHDIRTMSNSLASDGDEIPANGFWVIKNDSMRKQRENHSVLAMVCQAGLLQSTSIQVFVGGRVLFLLP